MSKVIIATDLTSSDLAGARVTAMFGAHARVTDAYVGPDTAIGDRAVIETAEISASVALPGARNRHVGVRAEDLPKALRVLVGRDAPISLG